MKSSMNYGRAIGAVTALIGVAGANATVFTFTPQCSNYWYGECITTMCPTGGWNTFNNWNNQHACTGGFPTPGVLDDVVLPALMVRQNGSVAVNSVATVAGTQWEWDQGNLAISQPFTLLGVVNVNAGSKVATGAFTNTGAWNFADTAGWVFYFQGLTFTNDGVLTQLNMNVNTNGGTNAMTNNGLFRKAHASDTQWILVPFTNNSTVRSDEGTIRFNSVPITTSHADARWHTAAGAAMGFENCTITGALVGDGLGTSWFSALTLSGDLGVNVQGNGLTWLSSDVNLGGHTLTNAQKGRVDVLSGSKIAYDGSIVNNGAWNFADTSGWAFYFQGLTFTNNGAITQSNMQVSTNGGTNAMINNGAFVKNHASATNWVGVPVANNGVVRAESGTQQFTSAAITTADTARWDTAAGTGLAFVGCGMSGTLKGNGQGGTTFSTLTLSGPLTWDMPGNGLTWFGGDVALGGNTLTNAGTGRVDVLGGTKLAVNGAIVNNGKWTFADTGGWVFYFQDMALTNNGTMNQVNMHVNSNGGTNHFTNNGAYFKDHASVTNWATVPVLNNGLLKVEEGTQQFTAVPVTSTPVARWDTAPGTGLSFVGCSLSGTFTGSGEGTSVISSASFPDQTTLDFRGTGVVWQGGDVSVASGKTLVNGTSGAVTVADVGTKVLSGIVVNDGQWNDGGSAGWTFYLQNASFTNNGTLTKRAMHWNSNGGINDFVNSGVVRKVGGSPMSFVGIPITNSGLIAVDEGSVSLVNVPFTQTAAGEIIVGGTLGVNGTFTVGAGRLGGAGTVVVPGGTNPGVVNAGATVAPGDGIGVLSVNGNYQQVSGALEVDIAGIAAGSGHDRLAVTGVATLGGTLHLAWASGYVPSVGDAFTILTTAAGGRTGTFDAVTNTELGYLVDVVYTPESVIVLVTGVTCDSIDFNRDTLLPDTQDIEDFITVFAGGPCSTGNCGDVDFNNDGLLPDTDDIQALLRVFSGGPCS